MHLAQNQIVFPTIVHDDPLLLFPAVFRVVRAVVPKVCDHHGARRKDGGGRYHKAAVHIFLFLDPLLVIPAVH